MRAASAGARGAIGSGLPPKHVTQLLQEWRQGNPAAADELMTAVYHALRRLARRRGST